MYQWTEIDIADYQKRRKQEQTQIPKQIQHKYKAKPIETDGIKFASKKEAAYYQKLRLLWDMKEINYFLMQVPFRLPGAVKHFIDFMIVNKDGSIEYVEVKGYDLPMGKMKRKMVEDIYKITIRVV